jgi:GntR family transcriptional regulator, transcriptional repressor for pyruvate dehydrogenase complex
MADIFNAGTSLRAGPVTLSGRMAEEIERRILTGELSAGDHLPTEPELGELFNVSRSVVRDAVRMLAARGLVEVRQGAGTIVAEPSDANFVGALIALLARSGLTMGEVIDARAAIEVRLAGLAAQHGTAEDWKTLEDRLEVFAQALRDKDWELGYEAHLDFHLGIVKAVHLPALELLLLPMQDFIVMSSLPPRKEDEASWEVGSHYPLLEAMRAGDPEASESAMSKHFDYMTTPRYASFRKMLFRDALNSEILNAFRAVQGRRRPADIGMALRKRAKRRPAASEQAI